MAAAPSICAVFIIFAAIVAVKYRKDIRRLWSKDALSRFHYNNISYISISISKFYVYFSLCQYLLGFRPVSIESFQKNFKKLCAKSHMKLKSEFTVCIHSNVYLKNLKVPRSQLY